MIQGRLEREEIQREPQITVLYKNNADFNIAKYA